MIVAVDVVLQIRRTGDDGIRQCHHIGDVCLVVIVQVAAVLLLLDECDLSAFERYTDDHVFVVVINGEDVSRVDILKERRIAVGDGAGKFAISPDLYRLEALWQCSDTLTGKVNHVTFSETNAAVLFAPTQYGQGGERQFSFVILNAYFCGTDMDATADGQFSRY